MKKEDGGRTWMSPAKNHWISVPHMYSEIMIIFRVF